MSPSKTEKGFRWLDRADFRRTIPISDFERSDKMRSPLVAQQRCNRIIVRSITRSIINQKARSPFPPCSLFPVPRSLAKIIERRQIYRLEQSRDKWKRRSSIYHKQSRQIQNSLRDMTFSRDKWKNKAINLEGESMIAKRKAVFSDL